MQAAAKLVLDGCLDNEPRHTLLLQNYLQRTKVNVTGWPWIFYLKLVPLLPQLVPLRCLLVQPLVVFRHLYYIILYYIVIYYTIL